LAVRGTVLKGTGVDPPYLFGGGYLGDKAHNRKTERGSESHMKGLNKHTGPTRKTTLVGKESKLWAFALEKEGTVWAMSKGEGRNRT